MKRIFTLTILILFTAYGFCLDYNSADNPFEVSCPVFGDENVLVKRQNIVLTEDLVSIDYELSCNTSKKVSALIDCKVLGFQRLCNDILIPLDFSIKTAGKEIPFEVYLNGKLTDKNSYYSGLEKSDEIYSTTDKIEIKFDFELDGEKTLNVSYKNLSYKGMFSFVYRVPLSRNSSGMPIDYAFVYKGIEDSTIVLRGRGISVFEESSQYFEHAENIKLEFTRFTEGEFFWKSELKQYSFPNKANFGLGFQGLCDISVGENEIIDEDLLYFMTKSQLALLRNTFYAIHGYDFKNKKYREYFRQQNWYKVNSDFKESDFNEIERANINLIKKYEER